MAVNIFTDANGQPDYERSVAEAAYALGIDPQIAVNQMHAESAGNPQAQSPKGAFGLMQLMPQTAKMLGVDPRDPAQNIEGGLRYLKSLSDKYNGNMEQALAAYNAGPTAVDSGRLPAETQAYVAKIMAPPNLQQGVNSGIQRAVDTVKPDPNVATGYDLQGSIKSGLNTAKDYVTNKANWPTIGGIAGGLAMAPFTEGMSALPLIASMGGAAGLGGATGEAAGEYASGKPFNPMDILKQGAVQGATEAAGTGVGRGLRRMGADMYSVGAGMGKTGLKRDIPGALQQGLEGGRFTTPQITSRGAQRVMDRVGPEPDRLIAQQAARGVQGDLPSDIAKRGMPSLLQDVHQGSEIPRTELSQIHDYVNQFIDEHSTHTPGTPPQTFQALVPNAQNIPYLQSVTTPGTPGTSVENRFSLPEQQAFKRGQQNRGAKAMLADKKGDAVTPQRQVPVALGQGAQLGLEDKVKGLNKANQTVQRQIGVLGSLNPSGVNAEQLVEQGISPEVANAVTSGGTRSPFSMPRLIADFGIGGTTAVATHDPVLGAAAGLGTAFLTSPLGMRTVGAGTYTAGRMLPMATRAAHAQFALTPSESRALQLAIQGK